jgi:hypothetical protein
MYVMMMDSFEVEWEDVDVLQALQENRLKSFESRESCERERERRREGV